MSRSRQYEKGNSFQSWASRADDRDVSWLVDAVYPQLPSLRAEWQPIVRRALADLSIPPSDRTERTFFLRPHVVDEIARLPKALLGRYLFHRYRYDVYPVVKELDAYPPCVQIEPTSICNLRCVFCFQTDPLLTGRAQGHMGQMSLDLFRTVVDQIEGEVDFVTLASRGEPLLAKDFGAMLAYASGKFLGLKINSNATHLDERRSHAILQAAPSTVVFSVDAADAATYERLRVNATFERTLRNIERFCGIRERDYPESRVITRVSGVAVDGVGQDRSRAREFWMQMVDQVAFVAYNPWENAYDQPDKGIDRACSDLWRRTFVWWDGRMNPCDVDYRSTLSSGTVLDVPLSNHWRGESYSRLRERHLSGGRQGISPCKGCVSV